MKNLLISAAAAVLIFVFSVTAFCKSYISEASLQPRLIDNGQLLSDTDESIVLSKLNEISERQEFDIVIVTLSSLDGESAEKYAADFYTDNKYGRGNNNDGILLLVSSKERVHSIYVGGSGSSVFTDAALSSVEADISRQLSDENYYKAFIKFTDNCDDFIEASKNTTSDNSSNMRYDKSGRIAFAAIIIFLIVTVTALSVSKKRSKSKKAL